jgi:N-acetylglucosamine-6-phosphate deacetylase
VRLGVAQAFVDGAFVPGDVEIADGLILGVGIPARGGDRIAVPGFVDIHINGYAGVDFLHANVEEYARAAEALAHTGVTAFQPTLITSSEEALVSALSIVKDAAQQPEPFARIVGVHLEGPFLSPSHPGVQPVEFLRAPDLALARRLLDAGPVTMMTLAPELPGALDLVDLCIARNVVVSCGHTDATSDEADRAFSRGVETVTHLFNAMRSFAHRDPGIAVSALLRPEVVIQIILDHDHLAPETSALVWGASRGRLCLVTDAIAAAGVGDGSFRLGEVEVLVANGKARLANGRIAGGTTTLAQAMRNLVGLGASTAEAIAAITQVPARVLGRNDIGHLRPGNRADAVVLNSDLRVERVILAGEDIETDGSATE